MNFEYVNMYILPFLLQETSTIVASITFHSKVLSDRDQFSCLCKFEGKSQSKFRLFSKVVDKFTHAWYSSNKTKL